MQNNLRGVTKVRIPFSNYHTELTEVKFHPNLMKKSSESSLNIEVGNIVKKISKIRSLSVSQKFFEIF